MMIVFIYATLFMAITGIFMVAAGLFDIDIIKRHMGFTKTRLLGFGFAFFGFSVLGMIAILFHIFSNIP